MNILSLIWTIYSELILSLPDTVLSYLVQVNLMLLCPIIAAYIGFAQGIRNRKIQILLMAAGALVAISLPLPDFRALRTFFPFLFLVLLLCCWYLPLVFSFLAHPLRGAQMRIATIVRYIIAALFLLNFLLCR